MLQIYLCCLFVISTVTFTLYGSDKARARRGAWRIPERTLLLFSFFGGAIGGLFGMALFRHKTRHLYFKAVCILGLLWQAALAVWLYTVL
jgi:uncharacterized membrane protein YsdA (DUF1294 family)